jgi:NAD(P)-dependent dehydrogenase (short-subunit alcohol dehydrogenase family)
MNSKICFVTGGTGGIGKDIVSILAANGHEVYFTARNKTKGKEVVQEIKATIPNALIDFVMGDLSSVKDVKLIAEELKTKLKKLDIIINNAGSYTHEKTLTQDGFEQQLAINYYAPRYFCEALLPLLEKSENGRIVNVTSRMHLKGSTNLNDLSYAKTKYSGFNAYAQTKLLVTAFTQLFADKIKNTSVTAVSMHPGVYSTGISRTLPKPIRFLWNVFIPGPIKGAENVAHLALNDRNNGVYFNKTKADKPHSAANNSAFWKQIENLKID